MNNLIFIYPQWMRQVLVLLGTVIWLTGCSWITGWVGDDDENPREPAKLVSIKESVKIDTTWRHSIGGGDQERHTKFFPFFTENNIYLAEPSGGVVCLALDTGKQIWKTDTKQNLTGGVNGDAQTIIVGTGQGGVIALNAADGKEKWRTTLTSEVMGASSIALNTVVVRTNDNKVHGLAAANGEILWQFARNAPALTLRGASVPEIAGDVAVIGFDDGRIGVINIRQGQELWQAPVAIATGRSEIERLVDIDGEFVVKDGIIYVASYQGQVVAVALETGSALWAQEVSTLAGLSVDADHVYISDADDNIWALDRQSGATLWKQDQLQYRELSAPAAFENVVVVGDEQGYLHMLDKSDGHFVGRTNIGGQIRVSPRVQKEHLYVVSLNGQVAALNIKKM